jgi:hypothetical protein
VIRSVYADSSPDPQDDPKVETIVEMLYRIWVSNVLLRVPQIVVRTDGL